MFAIAVELYKKSLLKGNHQILSIKVDALMDKVHKTFHYTDMTCDVAFISSAILSSRRVSLPDMFE
jgi:inorganic pyrophosphatase/exopolyphosphatase